MIVALIFGGLTNILAWFFSDTIAIKAMQGREIDGSTGLAVGPGLLQDLEGGALELEGLGGGGLAAGGRRHLVILGSGLRGSPLVHIEYYDNRRTARQVSSNTRKK